MKKLLDWMRLGKWACVCALAMCAACAEEVALKNPGFEKGAQGWDIPKSDGGMSAVTAEAAHSGAAGLRVADESDKEGSSARAPQVRVKPGMVYRLSFFARTLKGQGVGVYLTFYDAKGKRVQTPDGKDTTCEVRKTEGEHGWQAFSVEAKAPEGAKQLGLWIHSFSTSVVTADFDDFKLEELSPEEAAAKPMAAPDPSAFLPEFPKPDPERAFAALKALQPDGKALRAPQEDWEGARARAQRDAAWAKWVDGRRQSVDGWMANQRDHVEWVSGWGHDFVSPKDGSYLVWTPTVPGKDAPAILDKEGNPVELTPKLMNAWVFHFRVRHTAMIVEAARLWRLTGDVRYRDWAAAQLDFYADNYEKWPLHSDKGGPARLHLQPLDEATMMSDLTEAARLLGAPGGVSAAREKQWADKLFIPEAKLLELSAQRIHNIANWQRCAEAQIALLTGDEAMLKLAIDGPYGVRAQVARGVTSDYVWCEQSLGYNNYVVRALAQLFAFAALTGHGDLFASEGAVAQNMLLAPMQLRFATDALPNPADATGTSYASFKGLDKYYRILPTWAGLRDAADTRTWDTIVDPPQAIAQAAGKPGKDAFKMPEVSGSFLWESTRFAVLKKGDWQVFFHFGQLGSSHAQQEGLSWEAFYKKTDVSHDAGTVGYGSPMHKNFYKTGLCHNVPLVNGAWLQDWNRGELTEFDAAGAHVTARMTLPRAQTTATRTLRIDGDALIEQTQLEYAGPRRDGALLGCVWQLQGTLSLSGAFREVGDFMGTMRARLAPWQTDAQGKPSAGALEEVLKPFGYWKEVRAASFENEARLSCAFADGVRLNLTVQCPGRFTLLVASAPDRPPKRRTSLYLEKTDPARAAGFTLKIAP